MNKESRRFQWMEILLLIMGISLALPLYEQIQAFLKPTMGSFAAFSVAVLVTLVLVIPLTQLVKWLVQREQGGGKNDRLTMIYRTAAFPLFIYLSAALKNLKDLTTDPRIWIYPVVVLVFVAGAVAWQSRRGQAWSWWVALPVGFLIALLTLPITFGINHLITGN